VGSIAHGAATALGEIVTSCRSPTQEELVRIRASGTTIRDR
jgi:hypothetical protein